MASGKQVSFQFGEVSPAMRFNPEAASYESGLRKLANASVKKAGGVNNRPGFELIEQHVFQSDLMVEGGEPGIVGEIVYNPETDADELLEYRRDGAVYKFYVDGSPQFFDNGFLNNKPQEINFVPLKDRVLITPSLDVDSSPDFNTNASYDFATGGLEAFAFFTTPTPTAVAGGYSGIAPFLPVSYIVTAIYEDGSERTLSSFGSSGYNPSSPGSWNTTVAPATIVHPHAQLTTQLKLTFSSALSGVKYINYYRTAGAGASAAAGQGFYRKAGSVPYDGGTDILFTDYGTDDVTSGPPVDTALYGGGGGVGVGGVRAAAYYQQRTIMAYDTTIATNLKPGDIGVSKLGATEQITMPLIFNNTGPFQFTIPVTDNSPIVGFLAMERLIALTERGAYIIRGGEQGALTPTSVNPLEISSEGCSTRVAPRVRGRKGFFLNYDHTKIMAVEFSVDGNVSVYDASTLSEHLLNQDIHKIVVTGGVEDKAYFLRRDGKIVSMTVAAVPGFSLLEHGDGFIENIYVKRVRRHFTPTLPQSTATTRYDAPYDALYAYVIRDGVRYVERLAYREDVHAEGFAYMDSFEFFGERLSKLPDGSYRRINSGNPYNGVQVVDGARVNIIGGTTWLAGETVTLESNEDIGFIDPVGQTLDIFYDDDNGDEKYIRFVSQGTTTPSGGTWDFAWTGYFEQDIPTSLRNVEALNPSDKLAKQTRWLLSSDYIAGLAHLEGKEVSVFADGVVVSSPLNPNMQDATLTVSSGEIYLPEKACWGVVGLPYEFDFETLDLEAGGNRTLTDAKKVINAVGVALHETRGGFYGMPDKDLEDMNEIQTRDDEDISTADANINGHVQVTIPSEWTEGGRIRIRQVDPLPITVLAVYPKGLSGD